MRAMLIPYVEVVDAAKICDDDFTRYASELRRVTLRHATLIRAAAED